MESRFPSSPYSQVVEREWEILTRAGGFWRPWRSKLNGSKCTGIRGIHVQTYAHSDRNRLPRKIATNRHFPRQICVISGVFCIGPRVALVSSSRTRTMSVTSGIPGQSCKQSKFQSKRIDTPDSAMNELIFAHYLECYCHVQFSAIASSCFYLCLVNKRHIGMYVAGARASRAGQLCADHRSSRGDCSNFHRFRRRLLWKRWTGYQCATQLSRWRGL